MVLIIILAFIVICFTVDAIVHFIREKRSKIPSIYSAITSVFNETSIIIPGGIYFDKSHMWAFMERNGDVKIGVDDFLLHITGPINRVKMKNLGEKVQKGEPIISLIRDGKQLTINAPVSGTIKSQNKQLLEDSSLINESPYLDGWIYMIEPSNWIRDTHFLMMANKYRNFINEEFTRLKDFLSFISHKTNQESTLITLQDGGEIKDNVLSDFEPEVWEEFQTKFINISK